MTDCSNLTGNLLRRHTKTRGTLLKISLSVWFSAIAALLLLGFFASPAGQSAEDNYVREAGPTMFSYEELVALSEGGKLDEALAQKLEQMLTTPFVSNEAYYRGAKPHRPKIKDLGASLRLVLWNIERGLRLDDIKLLLTDTRGFLRKVEADRTAANRDGDKEGDEGKQERKPVDPARLADQIKVLQSADVIVLNEVDWGMKRTGYRTVIKELGEALNMNWAYGVEFVEIDPKILGTEGFEEVEDPQERQELIAEFAADRERLRALHGTAVLSRYPIREARLRPFRLQGYDWYEGEKNLSGLEKTKRKAFGLVGSKVLREMRRGGRTSLIVTLEVPDLPARRVTVAATHLEARTSPKSRRRQMEELLQSLRQIQNPVVIAGDLNTSQGNREPASFKGELYKRVGNLSRTDFWVNKGLKWATGLGLGYDIIKWGFTSTLLQSDPTARGLSLVAPNRERELFTNTEEFRFDDGFVIDFRGEERRTINGKEGTLANSNERAGKGFAATYQTERTVGAKGKFKLDWILVKAYQAQGRGHEGSRRFAPHFGRTLFEANYALPERLSDHTPISVDLPLSEPELSRVRK